MSSSREHILDAIVAAIGASALPDAQTTPLEAAVRALYASRPNAMDKVQAPLGRALRNPAFPGIWQRCVDDIPDTPVYADLRDAARHIATFVAPTA
ncbi:MAG: hypothetical protein H6733_05875 [Alphaproteobacteria bacterium]|nr:hypothetical protein [Alphaproteobacteria bacterium]